MPVVKKVRMGSFPGLIGEFEEAENQDLIGGASGDNTDYFWVIDGATPCCELPYDNALKDFLDSLDAGFKEAIIEHSRPELPVVVAYGLEKAILSFIENVEREVPPYALPTASMTMVKITPSEIEFAGIGDCGLAMRVKNEGFRQELKYIKDPALEAIDEKLKEILRLLLESNHNDIGTTRKELKVFVAEYRKRYQNTKDGYKVLVPMEIVMNFIKFGKLEFSENATGEVVLYSDGVEILMDSGFVKDDFSLIDVARRFTPKELYELAKNVALFDSTLIRIPRLKLLDDFSLIYVKW